MRVLDLARIPDDFELLQGLRSSRIGLLDGVGAAAEKAPDACCGSPSTSTRNQIGPTCARISSSVARRLGNEGGIGAIAALQAGERAIAGAFLLDHRLQIDIAARLQAKAGERSSA